MNFFIKKIRIALTAFLRVVIFPALVAGAILFLHSLTQAASNTYYVPTAEVPKATHENPRPLDILKEVNITDSGSNHDAAPVTMLQDTTATARIYAGDVSLGFDTVTAVSSDPNILPNPTISGNGATRTATLSPVLGKTGTVTVTFTATRMYNGSLQSMSDTLNVKIVPRPDLTVTKTHFDPWKQGDTDLTYIITVSNQTGAGPTLPEGNSYGIDPKVTVVYTIPSGLKATGWTGQGWNCSLTTTLTCDRSDVLVAGSCYPPIILTVNVDANASETISNQVTVSGNADNTPDNNSASDITRIFSTSENLSDLTAVENSSETVTEQMTFISNAVIAQVLSNNANLSTLTIEPGTLSPVFSSALTDCTADVAYEAYHVHVTPT